MSYEGNDRYDILGDEKGDSMKPETKFSNYLIPLLRTVGWFVQRIESGETGSGIPDTYLTKDGVSGWLELKIMDVNWPTDKKVPFRPGQWPWLHTNASHGGRSWLAVKLNNGYVFCEIHDVTPETYQIKKEGRSLLYLPKMNITVLDRWLLSY